jgi:regulator of sirC expression with transglutaminase-like and TPR domain
MRYNDVDARRTMKPLLLCVAVTLGGAAASANECASARQHLVVARRAAAVHDFQRAIREYQQSYELDGEPVTLVMLAQIYARAGDLPTAIDTYRAYLEEVPAGARAYAVEQEIARLSTAVLADEIPIFDDGGEQRIPIPIF